MCCEDKYTVTKKGRKWARRYQKGIRKSVKRLVDDLEPEDLLLAWGYVDGLAFRRRGKQ